MTKRAGRLVLVVGPSGAGKDSILRYAEARFAADQRFSFPRRLVTRAPGPAEDHDSIDEHGFDRLAAEGAFALHWQAHGLKYGVYKNINRQLAEGKIVAVNVSRTILKDAARRYPDAVIVEVTASDQLRAARLAARARETAEDAVSRTQRSAPPMPASLDLRTIRNDGLLASAADAFCGLLEELAAR